MLAVVVVSQGVLAVEQVVQAHQLVEGPGPQALFEAGAPVEYRIARRGLFAVAVLDVDLAAVHAFPAHADALHGLPYQFAEQAACRHARQVLALADGLAAGLEIRIVGGG